MPANVVVVFATMRNLLFVLALALQAPAFALTSTTTDVTDLWWNPDESGWGVNVVQQGSIVFATFFVYDTDGRAHWYVASSMTPAGPSSADVSFEGDLFEAHGPFFGVPFNANAVARNKVGTAKLEVTFPGTGKLTYSVNGTSVVKAIRRQTWAANDATGTYEGSRELASSSTGVCPVASAPLSNIRIAQSNRGFSMLASLGGSSCRFDGDYSQEGHLGASNGTFSCDNGLQGTYAISELETTLYGFFARYRGTERGCSVDGRIGGLRTTIRRPPAE